VTAATSSWIRATSDTACSTSARASEGSAPAAERASAALHASAGELRREHHRRGHRERRAQPHPQRGPAGLKPRGFADQVLHALEIDLHVALLR